MGEAAQTTSGGFLAHLRRGSTGRRLGYDTVFLAAVAVFLLAQIGGWLYARWPGTPAAGILRNHLAQADALAAVGDSGRALQQYRLATAIAPDDLAARLKRGLLAHAVGEVDEALEQFEEVLRRSTGNAVAHFMLGLIHLDRGRYDLSVAHNRAAVAANPRFVEAHNNLGTALLRQGRTSDAVDAFRRALAINPTFGPSVEGLRALERKVP